MRTTLNGSTQLYYFQETGPGGQDSIVTGSDTNARNGMLGVAPVAANSATKVAIFESDEIYGI